MKFGPYSFEKGSTRRGSLRELAVPVLVAGAICAAVTVLLVRKLRSEAQVEPKSDWVINWVDLTDYKKPEAPKTKEQK
jgi:hypothetical protein